MIEIAVRHRFGAFAIEADIRASGRILAISGPSGAGKTSLLNMISGLLRPDEGRIAVDGVVFLDTAIGLDMPTRQRRIGYVFQEPRLFPHLSVAGNLRYGARFARNDSRLVGFDEVVALLGIAHLLARRPARLSGGEKQRVAIGRALLSSSRALLLDEPLTAIDDARRRDILGLIEQLRDAFAIPIVFVSHRAGEVERLASEVAVLSQGRLVEMRGGAARA
jgi:molybdate transport system ATP-binding protein